VLGGDELHAVGRAGQRDELDLDAVLLEPAHLLRDRERRGGRGHGLGAPADADRSHVGGRGGARGEPETEHSADDCMLHHDTSPLLAEGRSASRERSQNRTRRRTTLMNPLRTRPRIANTSRIENWPATSMLNCMLCWSMPRPFSELSSSATMAPISAKIIAT